MLIDAVEQATVAVEKAIPAVEMVTAAADLPNEPVPMATLSARKVSNWFPRWRYSS
jgi:hypothetical protein